MTLGKTRDILPARLKPSLRSWFPFSSMARLLVNSTLTVIFPLHLVAKTASWWNIARNSSELFWKTKQQPVDNKYNARPEQTILDLEDYETSRGRAHLQRRSNSCLSKDSAPAYAAQMGISRGQDRGRRTAPRCHAP